MMWKYIPFRNGDCIEVRELYFDGDLTAGWTDEETPPYGETIGILVGTLEMMLNDIKNTPVHYEKDNELYRDDRKKPYEKVSFDAI